MTSARERQIKNQIKTLQAELAGLCPMERLGVREFARQAGISPTTATRIKRGEEPDMNTAKKILPFLYKCPCCGQPLPPPPKE